MHTQWIKKGDYGTPWETQKRVADPPTKYSCKWGIPVPRRTIQHHGLGSRYSFPLVLTSI